MESANIIPLALFAYVSGFVLGYFIQELRYVWHKKFYAYAKTCYESKYK